MNSLISLKTADFFQQLTSLKQSSVADAALKP